MRLGIPFDMFLNPNFKMTRSFDNIARTTADLNMSFKIVIFFQTILSFVQSRKMINIYDDIALKYGNVIVKDFRKYEKPERNKNKLKLDINFLTNCKQLGVCPKFIIFKLPNVSNKDTINS